LINCRNGCFKQTSFPRWRKALFAAGEQFSSFCVCVNCNYSIPFTFNIPQMALNVLSYWLINLEFANTRYQEKCDNSRMW